MERRSGSAPLLAWTERISAYALAPWLALVLALVTLASTVPALAHPGLHPFPKPTLRLDALGLGLGILAAHALWPGRHRWPWGAALLGVLAVALGIDSSWNIFTPAGQCSWSGLALTLVAAGSCATRPGPAAGSALSGGTVLAALALVGGLYARLDGNVQWADTSSLLVALGLVLLAPRLLSGMVATPKESLYDRSDSGGQLARRLLPAAGVLPVLLGAAVLSGYQAGIYNATLAFTLFAVLTAGIFLGLGLVLAAELSRLDAARCEAHRTLSEVNGALDLRVQRRTEALEQLNNRLRHEVDERRLAQERLAALLASAPDAILVLDPKLQIQLANDQAGRLFGPSRPSLLGTIGADLLDPGERSLFEQECAQALAQPGVPSKLLEFSMQRHSHGSFPAGVTARAVEVGQQRLLFLSIRDISWRKRAERSVRMNEARFRAVTDTAKDAILITDAEGRLEYLNPAAEALFGRTAEAIRGRSLGILLPLRYRERYLHEFERIQAHKGSRMLDRTLEIHGLRADDQEIPIELSLSSWTVEGELHFTCIARDIGARREAENDIRQLSRRLGRRAHDLEALNRELEAFSYSVSHDLRAPLRALDGFSRALLEDCGDRLGPEPTRHLHRIRASAQRMGSLIDDLILLARITRLELQPETVDLTALSRRIFDEMRMTEPERDVAFTAPETLNAQGDPRLLRIVLEHLLGNAWKFTRWAANPQVTLSHLDTGGEQVFLVRDNGDGFDMAHADKLFRPFQRLHENHSFPGNGIGLAMVQRIIQKHGGRIWAHGAPGKGASFYFTLGAREDNGRNKDDPAS